MEPPKDTIAFSAKVVKVEQRFKRNYVNGVGKEAQFTEETLGWFVALAGSHEALRCGDTKPNISKGDIALVRINFYE